MNKFRARFLRKFIEAFADKGVTVRTETIAIYPALGAWRTNWNLDVYRWQVHFEYSVGEHWLKDNIGSYCTMTQCCKGMIVSRDRYGWEAYSYSATHKRNAIDLKVL